jgi:hypothetical protein
MALGANPDPEIVRRARKPSFRRVTFSGCIGYDVPESVFKREKESGMTHHTPSTLTRRRVVGAAAGIAGGFLVTNDRTLAQSTTPEAGMASPAAQITPLGYVTMRMRPLEEPGDRDNTNAQVIEEFLPAISAVDGFLGYLVADVIDDPLLTFGVTVMRDLEASRASDEVAKTFVTQEDIDEDVIIEETQRWAGDLLMLGVSDAAAASAATPPLDDFGAGYFVTARIYQSIPGTDPRGFVEKATTEFLPTIEALPGFVGYLWFPTDDGFASVSLYQTEESATAATTAAKAWVAENLSAYTDAPPQVIDATVVHANLPIFA